MPKIRVTCPTCATPLELAAEFVGQEVQCGSCNETFTAKADRPGRPGRRDDEDDDRPRRKRRRDEEEDDDDFDDRPRRKRSTAGNTGSATASMVLGIFTLILGFCCGLLSIPTGILGVIFGLVGLNSSARGQAISGIVMSVLGMLLAGIMMAVGIAFNPAFNNGFNNGFNNNPGFAPQPVQPQPWNGGRPVRNFK